MFYSNTCVLVGLALVFNVVCISLCRVRKFVGPPKGLKVLFAGSFGKLLCLGSYYHQTSFTHQRLVLELSDLDLAESEQQQGQGQGQELDVQQLSSFQQQQPSPSSAAAACGGVMRDWVLVAAGLERLFLMLYVLIFAVVLSVYL